MVPIESQVWIKILCFWGACLLVGLCVYDMVFHQAIPRTRKKEYGLCLYKKINCLNVLGENLF